MDSTFETILSNPIYLAIFAIIVILFIYAIVKKIIKLIISIGIILILYTCSIYVTLGKMYQKP